MRGGNALASSQTSWRAVRASSAWGIASKAVVRIYEDPCLWHSVGILPLKEPCGRLSRSREAHEVAGA